MWKKDEQQFHLWFPLVKIINYSLFPLVKIINYCFPHLDQKLHRITVSRVIIL